MFEEVEQRALFVVSRLETRLLGLILFGIIFALFYQTCTLSKVFEFTLYAVPPHPIRIKADESHMDSTLYRDFTRF